MKKIKKMDLLVSFYITCLLIAEILGSKTFPLIKLFGYQLNASIGIFVFPILFSINDIISESFDKSRAKSVVFSGLLMILFLFVFSIFATLVPPSNRFKNEEAYDIIFMTSARICFASLTAFIFSGLLDIAIFHKLKEKYKNKFLALRVNLSNFISQFFDTTIFMTLAFYNFDNSVKANISFLLSIILPYWILKCFMSIIETPFTYLGVKWLKNN